GLALGRRSPPNRASATAAAAAATRGQISLMQAYDPSRLRAFDFGRLARMSDDRLLAAATVSVRTLDEHFDLPEGRYEARVSFEGDRGRPGEAFAAFSDRRTLGRPTAPREHPVVIGRASTPLGDPAVIPFELLLSASTWIGVSDAAAAAA